MSFANDLAVGFGYITVRELNCIQHVAALLPEHPVCVNIGSGAGTSVIAVMEARADAKMVDVDIDPMSGLTQIREAGYLYSGRYERIVSDSKLVKWPHECHYLFIDGDHSEPGIRGDLVTWLPHVAKGGYILLHDYWPYPMDHELAGVDYWPNVRQVADEVLAGYKVTMDVDLLRVYQA
jgi:hypothetical protein